MSMSHQLIGPRRGELVLTEKMGSLRASTFCYSGARITMSRILGRYSRDLKILDAEDKEALEMLKDLVASPPKNEYINTKALAKTRTVGDLKRALGRDPRSCYF